MSQRTLTTQEALEMMADAFNEPLENLLPDSLPGGGPQVKPAAALAIQLSTCNTLGVQKLFMWQSFAGQT